MDTEVKGFDEIVGEGLAAATAAAENLRAETVAVPTEEQLAVPPSQTYVGDAPPSLDQAAKVFTVGLRVFNDTLDNLSMKSLRRVLNAIVEYPLNDQDKKLIVHQDEQLAFEIAMELMEAKMIMVAHVVKEKQNRAEEAAKKEGEANGKV